MSRVCCRDEADEEDKEEIDRGAEEEDREETIEEEEEEAEEDEEDEEWTKREEEEGGGTEAWPGWCSQWSSTKESPLSWCSLDRSWSSFRRWFCRHLPLLLLSFAPL